MHEQLQFQSDRIEAVLSLHKIPARVTGGTVTPRWIRFQVLPMIGTKISKIKNLNEELAAALDAPNCRVSRRGAAIDVEVPRDDPVPVQLLSLYRLLVEEDAGTAGSSSIPPVTAVLGYAEDGAPLLIRLSSPDVAHILVAGTTGSGKTVLMQTMILSLAMANPAPSPFQTGELASGLRLMLIDPKGYAFGTFQGLPHLARPVIREAGEAAEALQSLVHLMERQSEQVETIRGNGNGSLLSGAPHVVVVIDELADLLMVGGKEIQWALTRLTQRGREAGIHIIAATQKPSAEVLGPLIKANFPVRLVGRVTCASDARTATGWSGTGAERLMGRGDFLAVAEGRVTRFQAAHVSPEEIREVVFYLTQNEIVTPSVAVSWTRPLARLAEVFRGGM
jgi:S-DNA-T family DNA segregation ATPase FtsK/SpoIIIE